MSVMRVYGAIIVAFVVVVLVMGHLKEDSADEQQKRRSRLDSADELQQDRRLHEAQQTERLAGMSGDAGWPKRLRGDVRIGEYDGPQVTAWDLQRVLSPSTTNYVFVGKLVNLERLPDENDRLTLAVTIYNAPYRTERCAAPSPYTPAVTVSVVLDVAKDRHQIESNAKLFAGPNYADCLALGVNVTSVKALEGQSGTLITGKLKQWAVIPRL